jgi:hypothetical protein
MSVLERYSEHDCSILLDCSRRDVAAALARALQQLGKSMNSNKNDEAASDSEDFSGPEKLQTGHRNGDCSIFRNAGRGHDPFPKNVLSIPRGVTCPLEAEKNASPLA